MNWNSHRIARIYAVIQSDGWAMRRNIASLHTLLQDVIEMRNKRGHTDPSNHAAAVSFQRVLSSRASGEARWVADGAGAGSMAGSGWERSS